MPNAEDATIAPFEPSESAPELVTTILRSPSRQRSVHHDIVKESFLISDHADEGSYLLLDSGLEYGKTWTNRYSLVEADPLSASVRCDREIEIARDDWRTRVETSSVMSADADSFLVTNVLDAYEGDIRVFSKTWTFKVPRNHL